MITKINELKEKYVNATSDKEREQINNEISKLSSDDNFADAMLQSLNDSVDKAKKLNKDIKIRQQLEGVTEILPLSYIAKTYFKKSRGWLHQRLNEYNVNGKPAKFTDEEINIFNNALKDISNKIGSISIV
ncbi:MAG: DUF5053 domain-containing protein [Tenacibaculum sp.]|nr:DUF5053 domain-containing protein [Tenacibaculum sp.]